MAKHKCTYPACACTLANGCATEERRHGKQLSFGERVSLEDGIDHKGRRKDEGRTLGDVIFAVVIAIVLIAGAIGTGFVVALRGHLGSTPPDTDLMSRSVHVDLNGKDTVRVTITDKKIYLYQTLTNDEKENLKETISAD